MLMKLDLRWHLIRYKFQEHNIAKAFELFRENSIEPVLIKGWAASRNYPVNEERVFLDIDLCVAPRDYTRAVEILAGIDRQKLLVDLHNGLRHLDTVDWDNLFENTELVKLQDTEVRLLRSEDHLRVLCVHWLTDGASNRERLWDIYYAVKNRPPDFDWNRCLGSVEEKRRKWVACAVGLAHLYLGLELEDTPFVAEVKHIPGWVIETVEKEWKSDERLIPLHQCLHDKKKLFKQIKKRIPPNPIQATIEMEGDFDNKPRLLYQIGDIFLRLRPSVMRLIKALRLNP
jgi:hypothetical protein